MRKLVAFSQVTLNGYFADKNADVNWGHTDDAEFNAFVADNAKGGGLLLIGRKTYEMMAAFWPTPLALKTSPVVAERMNNAPKMVFSRTLDAATWNNTRLVKGDVAAEVSKMKNETGPDMVILGSGTIITQLSAVGLIDEYQIVLNPIAFGEGKALFAGLKETLRLRLTSTRLFKNGYVFSCYAPK